MGPRAETRPVDSVKSNVPYVRGRRGDRLFPMIERGVDVTKPCSFAAYLLPTNVRHCAAARPPSVRCFGEVRRLTDQGRGNVSLLTCSL